MIVSIKISKCKQKYILFSTARKKQMVKPITLFKEKDISNFVFIWKPLLGFVLVMGLISLSKIGFPRYI